MESGVSEELLRSLLAAAGAEEAFEVCTRYARPAYAITAAIRTGEDDVDAYADTERFPLGGTRLGGTPDLPSGVAWPLDEDGRFGNFFGQLDLADLAERAPGIGLPPSGLISLFTTYLESAAEPVVIASITTPAGVALIRHPAPASDEDHADPDTGFLRPVTVGFTPTVSLPFTQRDFANDLAAVLSEDRVFALSDALNTTDDDTIGQLGGHGTPHSGDDFRRIIVFHRLGHPEAQWCDGYDTREQWRAAEAAAHGSKWSPLSRHPEEFGWIFDNADTIATAAADLRLLIRIDSNNPMRLNLMDWDPLYIYASSTELSRGSFGRLEAMVTQG